MVKKIWVFCAVIVLFAHSSAYAVEGNAKKNVSPVPPKLVNNPTGKIADSEPPGLITDPSAVMEMVYVKGGSYLGCFKMGSAISEGGPEEKPAHEVCVDSHYIGKYEVTQGQWKKIMGNNPSLNKCGDECPVENVSWNDAQDFIKKLNSKIDSGKNTIIRYRLPTEAEWEFAARSRGEIERYSGANDVYQSVDVAWYNLNTESTRPVGQKTPNGLGLFDMSGNVAEWTNDWYGSTYYATSPVNNPTGPDTGEQRVVRGGSFVDYPFDLRATYRSYLPPDYRSGCKGFRLVGVIRQSEPMPQKVKSQKPVDVEKK